MKKILLSTTALLGLTAGAIAADLPRRAAPPVYAPPVPVFTWTGFYVGVNAGYIGADGPVDSFNVNPGGVVNGPGTVQPFTTRSQPNGAIAGGQIGFNYQLTPGYGFVVGLEADFQGTSARERRTVDISGFSQGAGFGAVPAGSTFTVDQSIGYFGTVRGRLGYGFDRFMLYGTGGLAFAGVRLATQYNFPAVSFNAFEEVNRVGYTVGGGIEYAFTNNLSVKIEGLYFDLDRRTITNTGVPNNNFQGGATVDTRGAIIRGGLNARFNFF